MQWEHLQDYDMNMPNFMCYGGRKFIKQQAALSPRNQLQGIHLHLTFSSKRSKCAKVWKQMQIEFLKKSWKISLPSNFPGLEKD